MTAMTNVEAESWCAEKGMQMAGQRLRFMPPLSTAITIPLPCDPHLIPYFAGSLLDIDVDEDHEECMLWVLETSVNSVLIEEVGVDHFNRLLRSYGLTTGLLETPAITFPVNEFRALYALATFPILFSWDAYLIHAGRRHFAFISHDGEACAIARDAESESALAPKLKRWGARVGAVPPFA